MDNNKQDTSTLDVLQTSANAAKTIQEEPDEVSGARSAFSPQAKIQRAVKTGKAIAAATKGAAAGPYGAAAGFLWANRSTVVKAIAAVAFIMLLPVLFILMLPSIIFNGLTDTTDIPMLNNNAAIIKNIGEAETIVREKLSDNLASVMAAIGAEIDGLGENETGIIENTGGTVYFNTALLLSQYCAGKDDYKKINLNDLKRTLSAADGNLYTYSRTENVVTNEETDETTTVYTYTINYIGDAYFANDIYHLTEEQRMLANNYAQNLSLFLYGSNYHGAAGSSNVSAEVLAYEPLIRQYAEQHGVSQFVEVIKAVMMQESGGRHPDVMQCSECPLNTLYPQRPGGITDPEYSINIGIAYFSLCLAGTGCTDPTDLQKLSLALQGYNYGNGYIGWALSNHGGYTETNAVAFSNMMKAKLGWKRYGDTQYVPHVLRYYNPYGGVNADGYGSPFVGKNWREAVTSEYGYRTDPLTGAQGAFHDGIDIAYPIGTPINAIAGGTIIKAVNSSTGYGNHLVIDHGNGVTSLYGHCSSLLVTSGQVSQGDVIAYVGKSGRVTGAHLHLTIKNNGNLQNPRDYIE